MVVRTVVDDRVIDSLHIAIHERTHRKRTCFVTNLTFHLRASFVATAGTLRLGSVAMEAFLVEEIIGASLEAAIFLGRMD